MNRDLLVFVLLPLLLAGCSSFSSSHPPDVPIVVLEEEPDGNHWVATWHLTEPATGLLFERPAVGFRAGVFDVITPGFTFGKRGDYEVLRTDGDPVRSISVRFPEYSEWLEKEYEFFQTFSDGSVAVYTGHLVARPLSEASPEECEDCFIRSFRFVSHADTPIIVDGRVAHSPIEWHDEEQQGSYVYFGSIEPVATAEMISIIDPALPDWLESDTKRALPELFELYTERFGVALPERPTILFSYDLTEQSGNSSGGGTLPGQIQLTAEGTGWNERSDDAMVHLFRFLAHESVHLWNGQIVNYPDAEDSWMHEGSAEGLAERTLLELGLIDQEQFFAYQTAALNECRRGLGGYPLKDAAERKEFFLYYSCGNMLALVTEQMIPNDDLFGFWRELIDRSLESGSYGVDDYVAVLRGLGAEPGSVASLLRFVSDEASADALAGMLRRNGVTLVEDTEPTQSYGQSLSRETLFALMSDNCRGSYGFNSGPRGFELSESLDCGPIPSGGVVTAIGGHDVLRQGHLTWDLVRERCAAGASVELDVRLAGSSSRILVPCRAVMSERPDYLEISGRDEPGEVSSLEQIKAQSRRLSDAYVRGDIESLVDVYSPEGVAIPGGRDASRGRDDLLKLWALPEGRTVIRHEATPVRIEVEGDLAYDWGYYEGQAAQNGESLDPFRGIYTIVWTRGEDGLWQIAVDMWHGLRTED